MKDPLWYDFRTEKPSSRTGLDQNNRSSLREDIRVGTGDSTHPRRQGGGGSLSISTNPAQGISMTTRPTQFLACRAPSAQRKNDSITPPRQWFLYQNQRKSDRARIHTYVSCDRKRQYCALQLTRNLAQAIVLEAGTRRQRGDGVGGLPKGPQHVRCLSRLPLVLTFLVRSPARIGSSGAEMELRGLAQPKQ